MRVDVTEQDIGNGFVRDTERCPLALALSRVTGRPYYVTVAGCWPAGAEDEITKLPPDAMDFLLNFDDYKPVAPFTFEIDWEPTP